VLKKAGIVVAAAAAGLLAVSPLAFAGDSHKKDWGHDKEYSSYEQNSEGLINVSDTNVNVPFNVCNNDVPIAIGAIQGNVKDVLVPLTGALGLFGDAKAYADVDSDSSRHCTNGAIEGDGNRDD
jgi:hypothetical protein